MGGYRGVQIVMVGVCMGWGHSAPRSESASYRYMIVTTYLHELNKEIWLQLPFEEANYWSSYISWLGSSLFSLASEFSSVDKHKITINFVNQYQLRIPSPNQWSHKPTVPFLSVNWYTIGSWLWLRELNSCECLICCGHAKIKIHAIHVTHWVVCCT